MQQEHDMNEGPPIQLRLSEDGRTLEVFLPVNYLSVSTAVLLEQIRQQSEVLQLYAPLNAENLAASLRECRYGTWIPILKRMLPTVPVDEKVELLVPVAVSGQQGPGAYQAVRAGTPIARLRPSQPGLPGYDLLTGVIPVRAPRQARLPQGAYTVLSTDGKLLLAECDGEVVLRQMALHVLPSHVHDGDLTVADGPLKTSTGVTVQGNVQAGATIEAVGDIHIAGDVEDAHLTSLRGSIAVSGGVTGSPSQPSRLQAFANVRCGAMLHVKVTAGQDLHLLATANYCTLHVAGNVYLEQSLEDGLHKVSLTVGGGVLPRLSPPELVAMVPEVERQHVRVPTQLSAQLALHDLPPLAFRSCVLHDLSSSGVRLRLAETTSEPMPAVGTIVQVKFALPAAAEQILGIGRVVRMIGRAEAGIAFLQMRGHDQECLREFCQQTRQQRTMARQGTRADRRLQIL